MPFNRISPSVGSYRRQRSLIKVVLPLPFSPTTDPELHADMAERVLIGAGIAEGHVPKLHMILVIGALFRRERPLIHRIGNIKKFHHQLEIRHVVAHIAQGPDAIGKPARERGDRTDILRNIADAEGAAQLLQSRAADYLGGLN